MARDLVEKFKRSIDKRGWAGTAKLVVLNGVWFVRDLAPHQLRKRREAREFDQSLGVATSDIIQTADLEIDSSNRAFGTYHDPTPVEALFPILSDLGIDYARFTFVDLGSGLGRAVFLASQFPFQKIVGVEYSKTLHDRAIENLKAVNPARQRCRDIDLRCGDAAAYEFPRTPTVVYMANPFGAEVMGRVLDAITRSLAEYPRQLLIVYYNPVLDQMFRESPVLEQVGKGRFHSVYRPRTATSAS